MHSNSNNITIIDLEPQDDSQLRAKANGNTPDVDDADCGLFDLHTAFQWYDHQYFDSSLKAVEVRWSSRMTLCAGVCVYHKGGYCSVRLSEPLLKYRTTKESRETLLHEMIHAYLFVTQSCRDRDSHGPNFQSHMHRINVLTNLNITVYHNFKDEVNHYRTHVWKCMGPCQFRAPYFGILRRAMNRSPSSSDWWWESHRQTCGGQYVKESEPVRQRKESSLPKREKKDKQTKVQNRAFSKVNKKAILDKAKAPSAEKSIFYGTPPSKQSTFLGDFLRRAHSERLSGLASSSSASLPSIPSSLSLPNPELKQ